MMRGGVRSVASAVLAAGMIVGYSGTVVPNQAANQVLPVVAVTPADLGGPGGEDEDPGGGDIVPKPVGRGSDDSEPAAGGAAVPEPVKDAPEGAEGGDLAGDEPVPLPRPVGPSVPDGQVPAGLPGGPPATQNPSAQDALAMVGPALAKVNDLTAGLLKEFQASPNAIPLDFATTAVQPEQASQIVQDEGGDPERFTETVNEVGGPNPSMQQTPVLLRDQQAGFRKSTLFDVAGQDGGESSLVDTQGAKYKDFEDYKQNNTLSDTTQMVHPAELGKPAEGESEDGDAGAEAAGADPAEVVSGPAHETTFGERVGDFAKQVSGAAGAVGTSLLPGGDSDA